LTIEIFIDNIPHSQLNEYLIVLQGLEYSKHMMYLFHIKLAMVQHSVLCHHKHCVCIYQGVLPSSWLRYLNKLSYQVEQSRAKYRAMVEGSTPSRAQWGHGGV